MTKRASPTVFWAALQRRARWLIGPLILGLCLPWLNRLWTTENHPVAWLLDLASHWQIFFAAGVLLCTGPLAAADRRWLAVGLLAGLPYWTASQALPHATDPSLPTWTVASANVEFTQADATPLKSWVSTLNPDVLIVLELSPAYEKSLQSLDQYPYRKVLPADTPFGIGLYTRHPLLSAEIEKDAENIPRIHAKWMWEGREISVFAVHPMPPFSSSYHAARNALFLQLAGEATAMPTLVAGDLNASA